MFEQENGIALKIEGEGEHVIRTGQAIPLREPVCVVIGSTDPMSVLEWLEKKDVDMSEAHVWYSDYMVTLCMKEHSHYRDVVIGRLDQSDELNEWKLNSSRVFTPKELAQFLRFHQSDMVDPGECKRLILSLDTFQAKISHEVVDTENRKGNAKRGINTTIKSDVAGSFDISIPMFHGDSRTNITVDLCAKVSGDSVQYWLESPKLTGDMREYARSVIGTLIGSIRERFPNIPCIPVDNDKAL